MDIWKSLNGTLDVSVLSANPTAMLYALQNDGIILNNVKWVDDLTITFQIRRQDLKKLNHLADKNGADVKIIRRAGWYWRLVSCRKRPVLIAGLAIIMALMWYIPSRIFFFRVEGNQQIPTRLILEVVSDCGINFGASRQQVRSEKVKNALLEAVPQLQWAGINTAGCVATISVKERQMPIQKTESSGVSSIVAVRDGIIQELTVTRGSTECKVGQSVTEGQVLISGYTDCGLTVRAERAQGEIYASTSRQETFIMPLDWQKRGEKQAVSKKYSMIIGKKRINFYKDSGILDRECVKMYEENYVTLPGGFQLPILLITETSIFYENTVSSVSTDEGQARIMELADFYLRGQMVGGSILDRQERFSQSDGLLTLDGIYSCNEMIGREQIEEIITP